ncbi:MAG TPA: tRNA preQ1(34) S-adenosylmethionine ribosyltransferase-isomerase QueA [Allocoleopsis sp.]
MTLSDSSSMPATPDIDRNPDLSLTAYDYELPEGHIAQNPVTPRDSSRLLVVDHAPTYHHCIFHQLPDLLRPGDLLVLNNTRVIPARLYGRKVEGQKTEGASEAARDAASEAASGAARDAGREGARVEVLLLEEQQPDRWLALVKPGKRLKLGVEIEFGATSDPTVPVLRATVEAIDAATGGRVLQFHLPAGQSLLPLLPKLGVVPLPPYITESQADPEQYQTVYAKYAGSAAAPTAGLHFTPELLARLQAQGIQQTFITLHVGVGTFRPVEAEDITQHQMHGEWLEVPASTVAQIQATQAAGGRVIAVGTTSVRALEGAAAQSGTLQPYCGKTELFIYPGYQWQVVEGMITNFHLPKSSLMMLVSALIGRQRLLDLYQVAIEENYRFYSFGDAMLILPQARLSGAASV